MTGKLYLIATPIGNLKDITYRAVEILKEVDVIAAEDTRHSLKLLNYLEISKPMISYHRHNEDTKTAELIRILQEGKSIGLITDAGTPGISDPGEEVVKEAQQRIGAVLELRIGIIAVAQLKFHIALASGQPDLADKHIMEFD